MSGKPPMSVGINPTMAIYVVLLGGACAAAAYSEKYSRDENEIEERLMKRYYPNIKEQQDRSAQISMAIRGQDLRMDDAMNKLVWGGKANLTPPAQQTGNVGSGGEGGKGSTENNEQDSDTSSTSDEDLEDDKTLSKKERMKRRKLKREERRKKRDEEKKRLETERQKLVVQSIAAGAAIGAVAVAASMFVGNGRK